MTVIQNTTMEHSASGLLEKRVRAEWNLESGGLALHHHSPPMTRTSPTSPPVEEANTANKWKMVCYPRRGQRARTQRAPTTQHPHLFSQPSFNGPRHTVSQSQWPHSRLSSQCRNCGSRNHLCRDCTQPQTSYGIILIWFKDGKIQYLLICRRHTFGYTECIRSHFDITDHDYIKQLLCEMTIVERCNIETMSYAELWKDLWQNGQATSEADRYHREFCRAEAKFTKLRESTLFQNLLKNMPASEWTTPEWGFPKGKRNRFEDAQTCAQREFAEETGIHNKYVYNILGKRNGFHEPIVEMFQGTDGKRYRHVYYVAQYLYNAPTETSSTRVVSPTRHRAELLGARSAFRRQPPSSVPGIDPRNIAQTREIGAVEWCSYEKCMQLIRPYNKAKVKLLKELHPRLVAHFQRNRQPNQAIAHMTTTTAV